MSNVRSETSNAKEAAKKVPAAQPAFMTKIDRKVEGRGALLTIWQLAKFSFFGMTGGIIQWVFQLILPLVFKNLTVALPSWLQFLYNVETLDLTPADQALYIVGNTVTWGYMLPFFLANILANIYCYIMNKKYTFKSSAPQWHFVLYFVIMVLTILAMTWLQGVLYPIFTQWMPEAIARTLLLLPCGLIQTVVFFIAQKILLPPDEDLSAVPAEES